MKTALIFTLVCAIAGLLSIAQPVQVIGFILSCILLFTLVSRRRRDVSQH